MIGTIGHLGKVSPRKGILSAFLYALGTTAGAALVGAMLGASGHIARWLFGFSNGSFRPGILIPVGCLALFGGLRDLGFFRARLPQPPRQVPKGWWMVLGPYKTGFLWGLLVGLAFQTRIQYALYYVVALWVLLIGSPLLGAQVLAVYGAANGLSLVIETIAIAAGARPCNGLLGSQRPLTFFRLGGMSMLACGVYVLVQSAWVQ